MGRAVWCIVPNVGENQAIEIDCARYLIPTLVGLLLGTEAWGLVDTLANLEGGCAMPERHAG